MKYPEYVEINGKRYKINTDFRVAIECNDIALDDSIKEYEKALAIIYKLFGDEGLSDFDNHKELLDLGKRYLACDKEVKDTGGKPDMDYVEDMDYIEASFMSDYQIDLSNTTMHWWKFSNLLNGLSNSDMGNCCVLNRIRNLRNCDLKDIQDVKERERIRKAKESVALKRDRQPKKKPTEQQMQNAKDFLSAFGYGGDKR